MNTARQSDAVTWWRMGRAAKAQGYDIQKWAGDIRSPVARKLFLAGANGEPKPTTARRVTKGSEKEAGK